MKTLVVKACGASREVALKMALKSLVIMCFGGSKESTAIQIDGSATAKFVPTHKNRPVKKGKK